MLEACHSIAHDLFAKERTPCKLAAGQIWFAWTEDPNDALGNRLREYRALRRVADAGRPPEIDLCLGPLPFLPKLQTERK